VIKLSIRWVENVEFTGLSFIFWFEVMIEIDNSGKVSLFKRLILKWKFKSQERWKDRLCGLVVRVPGYRSRSSGFDSRLYHIFWEVMGLERGPLILVSTTEELREWKRIGSGSRNPRIAVVVIRCADHATPSIRKSWTWPTSGGRSVDIVRLWTKATEFSYF
jgi:hypothetical protein